MGWIRAMKGHPAPGCRGQFQAIYGPFMALHAETTHKLMMILAPTARFIRAAGQQPARRARYGEPLRLMIDLPNDAAVITCSRGGIAGGIWSRRRRGWLNRRRATSWPRRARASRC